MMVEWVSELIWHLRRALSSLGNTRGVWCNTNRRKAALHRSTRWINHQPVNKSVSISSWIVAFVTLKWIWYFSWALLCVVAIDHCFEPETRRWHLWFRLFTKPIGGIVCTRGIVMLASAGAMLMDLVIRVTSLRSPFLSCSEFRQILSIFRRKTDDGEGEKKWYWNVIY